ncbi:hypothetical protein ACLB2K_018697 [Fragaria x ananassa]
MSSSQPFFYGRWSIRDHTRLQWSLDLNVGVVFVFVLCFLVQKQSITFLAVLITEKWEKQIGQFGFQQDQLALGVSLCPSLHELKETTAGEKSVARFTLARVTNGDSLIVSHGVRVGRQLLISCPYELI